MSREEYRVPSSLSSVLLGAAVLQAVGDELIDSVVTENIPILTEDEKFNETITSTISRVSAVLEGQPPSHPYFILAWITSLV